MRIEDTLNGGYLGLYNEVVVRDIYRMRNLPDTVSVNDPKEVHEKGHKRGFNFIPSVICDLGCNVGVFSRYARLLYPDATIVAIEPDKENCKIFKEFTSYKDNIILIEKAIGNGKVYHSLNASNGSGEVYLTSGVGFPEKGMKIDDRMEESDVETILLSEIIDRYVKPTDKLIIKLDVEGNEHSIFFNEKEFNALKRADYICAEIHKYALTGLEWQEVQDRTDEVLKSLELTHDCLLLDRVNFYATKKQPIIKTKIQLPELMRSMGLPMVAVEIGVACGYSSEGFMQGGIEKLYGVDVWSQIKGQAGDGSSETSWHLNNLKEAKQRLKPYGDKVKFLRGLSSEMAWMIPDNSCGLIYCDGDHSFNGCMGDIESYYSKLVSGGLFAFHDYELDKKINAYGVRKAVNEFAELNDLEVILIPENSPEDTGAYFIKP